MKSRSIVIICLAAALCCATWYWQEQDLRHQALKRQLQFRGATVMPEQPRWHISSSSSALSLDVLKAARAEFAVWQKQFHLGDAECQQRLAMQQLTASDMHSYIIGQQRDEAWLEQQLRSKAPLVTEAEARTWFARHAESLRLPVRYRVTHFFLSRHDPQHPDRAAEMQQWHQKLMRGEISLSALAAKHSEDSRSKVRGGDLGWITASRMPSDFIQAVGKLPLGQISPPIETKLGWHLIRVDEHHPSRLPEFAEVCSEIIAKLDQQRREKVCLSL